MSEVNLMLSQVVPLAEQFGPFVFAILFVVVITRTAHGYYRECSTRVPAATPDELKTYKNYFNLSMWFGVAVTTLSIFWWLYAHLNATHVNQVTIKDLKKGEEVSADYFSKLAPHAEAVGLAPMRDLSFVIVQREPFFEGEQFAFLMYKQPADPTKGVIPTKVFIKYSGHDIESFVANFESTIPTLELASQEPVRRLPTLAAREPIGAVRNVAEASSFGSQAVP